jgi:cyanophycinase
MSPSRVPDGESRGYIIPIGGAEEKEHDPRILKRFVALCGGSDADIVVIPTASRLADTGSRYERIFRDLGAGRVTALDFDTRRDCFERNRLERLEEANGIFFTGGNQLRLTSILGGTPVAKLVRILNAKGVHTAGTSAGASFLSEHMIAFGQEGAVPTLGCVSLAPGLGLTNRFIIDQHFRQRDRLGRLLSALAFNPFSVGLGLDEDTAAFIGPDSLLEVEGKGGITVVDAAGIEYSGMDDTDPGQPICMLGLTVHILVSGASFNLHTRKAYSGPDARSWAKASS